MTNEEIKLITDVVTKSVTDSMTQLIDEKLAPIYEKLEVIEEDTKITRAVVNELVEWVDYNFHDEYPFPVDKKKAM